MKKAKKRRQKSKANRNSKIIKDDSLQRNSIISKKGTVGGWIIRKLKAIYKVLSVISVISVFSCIFYWIAGPVIGGNLSDNDIRNKQILSQLNKEEHLVALQSYDIHGYGDESLIVVADGDAANVNNNRVLILEKLTNGFWSRFTNPFGEKSEYITKFSYKYDAEWGFAPVVEYIGNICDSAAKEIVLGFEVKGSTYGCREIVIIGYSEDNNMYGVIGTYPPVKKYEGLNIYEKGRVIGHNFVDIEKCNTELNTEYLYEPDYSSYCVPIWVKNNEGMESLLVVSCSKLEDVCLMNMYVPYQVDGELHWQVYFSEYVKDFYFRDIFDNDKLLQLLNDVVDGGYQEIKWRD